MLDDVLDGLCLLAGIIASVGALALPFVAGL